MRTERRTTVHGLKADDVRVKAKWSETLGEIMAWIDIGPDITAYFNTPAEFKEFAVKVALAENRLRELALENFARS